VIAGALLILGVAGLGAALRRRNPVFAFGVAWAAIALLPVSNLLVATGQVLAERTMMLPSVGALLILGALAPSVWGMLAREGARARPLVAAATAALLVAGALSSAGRQRAWESDDVVWTRMVEDAPASYWAHWVYGDWLFTHGRPAEGERHMRLALVLYPDNPYITLILAQRYQDNGFCVPAVYKYQRVLQLRPEWWAARLQMADCLLTLGHRAWASSLIERGLALGPGAAELEGFRNERLGTAERSGIH
jgi:predicted Zn-dependent protease